MSKQPRLARQRIMFMDASPEIIVPADGIGQNLNGIFVTHNDGDGDLMRRDFFPWHRIKRIERYYDKPKTLLRFYASGEPMVTTSYETEMDC